MQELDSERTRELLREGAWGALGLADDGRAYTIPVFYGYDGDAVYFHSHPGLKDAYIASTTEACFVVAVFLSEDEWASVQVRGPLEKLTLTDDIEAAQSALMEVPLPPEYGVFPGGKPRRSDRGMYYLRLKPQQVSGMVSMRIDDPA